MAQDGFPKISSGEIIINRYHSKDFIWNSGVGGAVDKKAKYFPYSKKIKSHAKIKTVVVNTTSEIEGAKVKLHFYNVNPDGSPGNEMGQPILFQCKKGKNDTTIDVASHEITVPETGIFVVFEWLRIEENKLTAAYSVAGKNGITIAEIPGAERKIVEKYMPNTAVILSRKNIDWEFKNNKWSAVKKDNNKYLFEQNLNPAFGKYQTMAVGLILTQ